MIIMDKYVKVILTIIAISLIILIFKSNFDFFTTESSGVEPKIIKVIAPPFQLGKYFKTGGLRNVIRLNDTVFVLQFRDNIRVVTWKDGTAQ